MLKVYSSTSSTSYFLLFLLTLVDQCAASCYWLDGTNVNAHWNVSDLYYYQPCHNDTASNATAASMCCATGPGRVAEGNADRCVDNGLCYSDALRLYWRESCTDQTWQDPACIRLFVNGTNNGTDVPLTACPDGSWCADNVGGSQGCCAAGDGFVLTRDGTVTLHNGSAVSGSSSSSLSSSSPSSTTQLSSTSSPSPPSSSTTPTTPPPPSTSTPAQNPTSSSLSSGAKAGIGIGAAVGVIALLLGVYFFLRKARRNRNVEEGSKAHEMHQPPPPAEMHATSSYPELDPTHSVSHQSGGHKYSLGAAASPAQLE